MRYQFYLTLFILFNICCFSCKSSLSEADESKGEIGRTKSNDFKQTQALLLTQPFDFDSANKNKIVGDYVAQTKISIPQDLATQSKWMMFEGPVLENDLVAYRYYADSRHRFDIFGKKVSDLVMDTVGWNYHDIMNWGSDILKVGNSLGLGSPAIWYKDTLYTLSECDEKAIEIIDNKNNKSTIRTTFKNLNIENETFSLVQDWSIEAGKPWTEIHLRVVNGKLPDGMYFATGIVKHLPDIIQGETSNSFYAMNWGKQSFHKENMGMAIVVDKKYQPEKITDDLSHAYAFKNNKQEVYYRFLSAWERDKNEVKDVNKFQQLVVKSSK